MSVIKAILFYSKRDKKSLKMKNLIQQLNADIDTVSVDSQRVRDSLLDDDHYGIKVVPSILVLFSSGQHKVYIAEELDVWFGQLVTNIQNYNTQQLAPPEQTPLMDPDDFETYSQPDDGVPKALRRSGHTEEIRSSLAGPGRPRSDTGIDGSGMGGGGISSAQSAMISEHIRDANPTIPITSDPNIQPTRKEVKKDTISAAELAKQMAEQREQFEEKVEENRPFL